MINLKIWGAGRFLRAEMIPSAEKQATWDLFVVWQRGKTAGTLRTLLDVLQSKTKAPRRLEETKV